MRVRPYSRGGRRKPSRHPRRRGRGRDGSGLRGAAFPGPAERSEHFEFSNTDLLEIVGHDVLAEAEQLARGRGVKQVDTGTRIGRPGDEVVEYAEAIGADLIVTGTRGLSDLPGILLGSVSHRIIHLATVPVLVVR